MALRHPARVAALILIVPRAYAPGCEVEADDNPPNRAVMAMIMRGADFAFWLALKMARGDILRFLGVTVTRVMTDNGSCYRSRAYRPGLPDLRSPQGRAAAMASPI